MTFDDARAFALLLAESAAQQQVLAKRLEDDAKRRAHLDRLIAAVDGDLDAVWQDAEEALRRAEGEH